MQVGAFKNKADAQPEYLSISKWIIKPPGDIPI
jgi:hypothetical protein